MKDYNFLPSFSIELLDNTRKVRKQLDDDPLFDLFDTKIENNSNAQINLDKL